MKNIGLIVLAILQVLGLPAVHSAPPTQSECLGTLMNLSSCMKFVMMGSNDTSPESTCCEGLKNVLETDANTRTHKGTDCLCDAFNNGGSSYGVRVNQTKSLSLADACSVTATNCTSVRHASAPAPAGSHPLDTPPSRSAPGTRSAAGIRVSSSTGSSWLATFIVIAAVLFIYS